MSIWGGIAKAYKVLWRTTGNVLDLLENTGERSAKPVLILGAVGGVLCMEMIYFSNAKDVRLLYVILVAIPGGLLGALFAALLGGLVRFIAHCLILALAIGLSLLPVLFVIYLGYLFILLLHSIVIWRN